MPHQDTIAAGFFITLALLMIIPASAAHEPCSLTITSIPQGGDILIDDIQYARSPAIDIPVSCEVHAIGVRMDGYSDYASYVRFESGNHSDITADLRRLPDRGLVTIRSEPPGGELFVDGKARGVTPVTAGNLLPGRHEILVRKTGYDDYHDVVSVVADTTTGYTEYLVPLPGTGFLGVTSTPEGADVRIDGSEIGKTPTSLQRIGAGNHTVDMSRTGYWNFSGIVNIRGGEATLARADLDLIPTSCTLYVDSSPQGIGIYLNDTFKGYTPATLERVPSGYYLLRMFRPENGAQVNRSFTFREGSTHEIVVDLTNASGGSVHDKEWQYENARSMTKQPGWIFVNTTPVIERSYTWIANGHEATVTLDIPRDLYDYYRNQPHPINVTPDTISSYAINDREKQYIHALVNRLKDASDFKSYRARNDYRNVVAFVQSVEYADDIDPVTGERTEYPKYPVETLADGTGDCEDTAILTAALLKEMGYDVAVVLPPGHAAVAVTCDNCNGYYYPLNGKRYYYLETTGAGYSLGTMDKKYRTAGAKIVPF